jgi:hypothetical protein
MTKRHPTTDDHTSADRFFNQNRVQAFINNVSLVCPSQRDFTTLWIGRHQENQTLLQSELGTSFRGNADRMPFQVGQDEPAAFIGAGEEGVRQSPGLGDACFDQRARGGYVYHVLNGVVGRGKPFSKAGFRVPPRSAA